MELYLNELNTLKDMGDMERSAARASSSADSIAACRHKDAQESFHNFLQIERVRSNLNQATTYDLIASHGNMDDLIFYATLAEGT